MRGGRLGSGIGRHTAVTLALVAGIVVGTPVLAADDGDARPSTLAEAVGTGDVAAARSLLAAGADPDGPRVNGFTPLMRAAIRDDVPMVELLLLAGADIGAIEAAGLTAVHLAAQRDATGTLSALAAAGADLEARSASGMAAIHHAATGGAVEAIRLLHGLGLDLDARSAVISQGHGYPRDIGATPLAIAVRAGRIDAVRTLLELGADVDATSASGHTPLLAAVFFDVDAEIVRLLLESGADRTVVAACDQGCSGDGGDALDWARELGREELIALLEGSALRREGGGRSRATRHAVRRSATVRP